MLAALNESKSIIECGTSFGVSTIYMALAVNRNVGGQRQKAFGVLTIEKDLGKVAGAKGVWNEAGKDVEDWIDARSGDILEVLKEDDSLPDTVDLVFLDGTDLFYCESSSQCSR
jgi:predicted O-methyltransferase YrrM